MVTILLFAFLAAGFLFLSQPQNKKDSQGKNLTPSITLRQRIQAEGPKEEYLLIPYWTLDPGVSQVPYDKLIYFGIAVDRNGIEVNEQGHKKIKRFTKNVSGKSTYLILRMLNNDTNQVILNDPFSQEKIMNETISIAKEYNFSGIILDFETQGLPFETLVSSITLFHDSFSKKAHLQKLSFGTLLYGDTFYRVRPYDVSSISKNVDRVYVMAYDFSKAKGDPGPNFPLNGVKTYGYDFKSMVSDFVKAVQKDKLTIIFGMYGYDWNVDEKGRGRGLAESKSTLAFEKFMTECVSQDSCSVEADQQSEETKITYTQESQKHVIWFENHDSVTAKKEFLNSVGVRSVGYWAYSYF